MAAIATPLMSNPWACAEPCGPKSTLDWCMGGGLGPSGHAGAGWRQCAPHGDGRETDLAMQGPDSAPCHSSSPQHQNVEYNWSRVLNWQKKVQQTTAASLLRGVVLGQLAYDWSTLKLYCRILSHTCHCCCRLSGYGHFQGPVKTGTKFKGKLRMKYPVIQEVKTAWLCDRTLSTPTGFIEIKSIWIKYIMHRTSRACLPHKRTALGCQGNSEAWHTCFSHTQPQYGCSIANIVHYYYIHSGQVYMCINAR